MRDLLRGIALGVLLATGILAFVYYTYPNEVVVKEKEYSVEAAITYLEKHDYEVVKNETKPKTSKEKETDKSDEKEKVEKETEKPEEESVKEYQLVIKSGMNSLNVAELLYENGIIDDAEKFNQYLEDHGYQGIIGIGTYQLTNQMNDEQIAKMITNS